MMAGSLTWRNTQTLGSEVFDLSGAAAHQRYSPVRNESISVHPTAVVRLRVVKPRRPPRRAMAPVKSPAGGLSKIACNSM